MPGGVEMFGRVLVGGIVAAADMAAGPAEAQMQPLAAALQAFLAAERTRRDIADALRWVQPFAMLFPSVFF
jgi:hypothetical protein